MLRSAADSFFGSHTNRIDAKGRVAAPAAFRNALDLQTFKGFYAIPSPQGPFLICGGLDYMAWLKASIYELPPFDPGRRVLETKMLGKARPVSVDADGRFILPEAFRRHADLAKEAGSAFFLGVGDTFQIWESEDAAESANGDNDQACAALQRLGNPQPPAPFAPPKKEAAE